MSPHSPIKRGFLHRGWREGNPSSQQLPVLTRTHWLLLKARSTLLSIVGLGVVLAGSWSMATAAPSKHCVGRPVARKGPTRAAAQVDITALNGNLVFCCVFLRDCTPDQTAFLGLHPIFIL